MALYHVSEKMAKNFFYNAIVLFVDTQLLHRQGFFLMQAIYLNFFFTVFDYCDNLILLFFNL
jgi:hypothetical protein